MFGVTVMILGGVIYWLAATKICPHCSVRVKYVSFDCKNCGRPIEAR